MLITPVAVSLEPVDSPEPTATSTSAGGDELALSEGEAYLPNFEFFTNFDNFYGVTAEQVADLLQGFWRRYEAFFGQQEALDVLGLTPGVSWPAIQEAYRQLASAHHPDRGGDRAAFIKVRRAYESLKSLKK